jgi:type I restriction enzyme S subunit
VKWKPYLKYKDSGVEWLGEVPGHWHVETIKQAVRFTGGGTPSKDVAAYWTGDIPWVSPKDMKVERINDAEDHITDAALRASAASIVPIGAVLVVVRSGILRHTIPVAIAETPVALNQDMKALTVRSVELEPWFLLRWIQGLQSELITHWKKQGATVESLEHEYIANTLLPVPTRPEQLQILKFLDRETAKIDFLIAKQERLIELLQEKRQALIGHAVTKGLNPDAPMKSSGVEWLGDVPAHWEVTRLRRIADGGLINGLFKTRDSYGQGAPLVNVFDVYQSDFQIQPETLDRVHVTSAEMEKYNVLVGDLVFVRSSLKLEGIGVSAFIKEVLEPTVFECHLVRLRPRRELVVPRFLSLYLSSMSVRHRLVASAQTTTMTTIGQEGIACLEVLLPPEQEQVQLVDYLSLETRKYDEIVAKAQRSIELMCERRTALISAAVTGKIDVREPSHA